MRKKSLGLVKRPKSKFAGMTDEQITQELNRLAQESNKLDVESRKLEAEKDQLRGEREQRIRDAIATLSDQELADQLRVEGVNYEIREIVNREIAKRRRRATMANKPRREQPYKHLSHEQLIKLANARAENWFESQLAESDFKLMKRELKRRAEELRKAMDIMGMMQPRRERTVTEPPPKAIEGGKQ